MRRVDLAGYRVVLALALAALAGCGGEGKEGAKGGDSAPAAKAPPARPGKPLPQGVTAAMVEQGRELYGTGCEVCHGADGGGTQLGPSLTDAQWLDISGQYPEIVTLLQQGVPQPKEYKVPMPPLGGGTYNDEQVRALAAYVHSLAGQ